MRISILTILTLVVLLAAITSPAQGPRGPQAGFGNGPAHPGVVGNGPAAGGSGLDMSKVTSLEGTVTSINIGFGNQYPSIQINSTAVKIAPVWFLLDNNFEIKSGDTLSVVMAPGTASNDAYLYAIKVVNLSAMTELSIRDAFGLPLWTRQARGNSSGFGYCGSGCGSGCVDAAGAVIFSGAVDTVSMGVGIQMPSLSVKTADGKLVTVKIGPEHVLLENDFELKTGDAVIVKAALATCTGEYVALQITGANGQTLILRNDDGTPAWN